MIHHRQTDLLEAVARVRRRWRARRLLQGVAAFCLAALAVLLAGGGWLAGAGLSAGTVLALRAVGWLLLIAVLVRWLVLPLIRRVSDEQVALYVEEHDPGLQAVLVSALEQVKGAAPTASPALAERVVAEALGRLREADDGRRIEAAGVRRASVLAVGAAGAVLAAVVLGPGTLRDAARALFLPWEEAVAASAYAVLVEPGDATVARGGDVEIGATLRGFSADRVELLVRTGDDPEWQRLTMSPADSLGRYTFRLFDVTERIAYVVEASGVRSKQYTLTAADLPTVAALAIELQYPAFTGQQPERQEPGGDIVAPRGTTATFFVTPSVPVAAGRIVTAAGDTVTLRPAATGTLEGALRLERDGPWHIELQAPGGAWVEGSLTYRIDLLDNRGPSVVFRTPGRDVQATAVEEVFTEVEATDDYGVRRLELVFRVNGGDPRTVTLLDRSGRSVSVQAGHTFFLEEHGLAPGDVVSYFARATDNGPAGGATAATDIYFVRIRPFGKDYRQAEQRGASQQSQMGGDSPDGLSEQQRQIVSGTYKVERDGGTRPEDERREDLTTLALAQGKLRERVTGLVAQLAQRSAVLDSGFAIVQENLSAAVPLMSAAEIALGSQRPGDALGPEERALQHLQRAEEAFREVQVSMEQGAGGGGGGNQSRDAEELVDLFELETDKLRNQYETLERSGARQQEAQVDEVLERLRQLAARQQQENERARRALDQLQQRAGQQGVGSQGSAGQRRMAQEAEELARQLERLARDQESPELTEAARGLQQAADDMRRAAAGQAQGARAAERLSDAARQLERGRSTRTAQGIGEAARRAAELADRQRGIGQDLERALAGGRPTAAEASRIAERKDSLAAEVDRLEADLDRLGRETRGTRPDAGRRIEQAAEGLRDSRVEDRIRFSKNFLRGVPPEYARTFEQQVVANLDSAAARIGAAGAAFATGDSSAATQESLDRARQLVQGMESLRERAEGRRGGEAEGQAGEQAQPAPSGSPSQPGGAGRPGFVDPALARQFTRELRARREAAESLAAELEAQGMDAADLEEVARAMRGMEGGAVFADPGGLARLERDVLEPLRAFEYALRRQLGGLQEGQPVVAPGDQVPPRFRALVEEYYRSLARARPQRGTGGIR
jgi:murein L,D-transpeptidase YcbB/YkuD